MMDPAVVVAYAEAFAHLTARQTFAVLDISNRDTTSSTKGGPSNDRAEFIQQHAAGLEVYNISESMGTLQIMRKDSDFVHAMYTDGGCSKELPGNCYHRKWPCQSPIVSQKQGHTKETMWNIAEQAWKLTLCGRMIRDWEAPRGRFEWIIRWRPDAVLLAPFLSMRGLSITTSYTNFVSRDWYFICPREHCDAYLFEISRLYLNCTFSESDGPFWEQRKIKAHPIAYVGYKESEAQKPRTRNWHPLAFLDKRLFMFLLVRPGTLQRPSRACAAVHVERRMFSQLPSEKYNMARQKRLCEVQMTLKKYEHAQQKPMLVEMLRAILRCGLAECGFELPPHPLLARYALKSSSNDSTSPSLSAAAVATAPESAIEAGSRGASKSNT
jgi:hypothetical protein